MEDNTQLRKDPFEDVLRELFKMAGITRAMGRRSFQRASPYQGLKIYTLPPVDTLVAQRALMASCSRDCRIDKMLRECRTEYGKEAAGERSDGVDARLLCENEGHSYD